MNWPTLISIWALSISVCVLAFHIRWVFKRHLELQHRVHELEMERDFPGYTARKWAEWDR